MPFWPAWMRGLPGRRIRIGSPPLSSRARGLSVAGWRSWIENAAAREADRLSGLASHWHRRQLPVDQASKTPETLGVGVRHASYAGYAICLTDRGHLSTRRITVLRDGRRARTVTDVVGARSNVLQEFAGGPGQVALRGTGNTGGVPGMAVSHGCVRVATDAIVWLAGRIGPGTLVTIER
jgi:hypothetical protein